MSSQKDLYREFANRFDSSVDVLAKYLYFDSDNYYVYVMWGDSVTKFSS